MCRARQRFERHRKLRNQNLYNTSCTRLFYAMETTHAAPGSGSGSVIAGNQILTNAHVMANASYVQAQKHNDPQRYLARVTFVSHEADLAIITVDDPGFFSDLQPLSIGLLPEPLQEVSVYGYPIGGKSLSITKGILSRVEQQIYAHAGAFFAGGANRCRN